MKALRDRFDASLVMPLVAIGLLFYRFFNLDLVTLINDEPHLLDAAEQEAHGGSWVIASPISGTQGVHYGPVPTWFYGIVHFIFGSSPLVSIVAMGLVVTIGQLVFTAMLVRLVRGGPALFGALIALLASSPFGFAWSRTAWDNTVLIGTFSCAALLLAEDELTTKRSVLAGVLFGLAIGSHLMVLPALIALFAVTVICRRKQWKKTIRAAFFVGLPALVINLPYLWYLEHLPKQPPSPHASGLAFSTDTLAAIVNTVLQPARIVSLDGISYFFDEAWGNFRAWLGPWSFWIDDASFAFVMAALALAGLLVSMRRAPSPTVRRLAMLAFFSWISHSLFLVADRLDPHPHYQHPIWWTIPTGIALLVVWLRSRAPVAARGLVGAVWIMALAQFAFLPMWMRYVREQRGTRGIHYTTVLSDERAFMDRACSKASSVVVENRTVMFEPALDYIAKSEDACHHVTVSFCRGSCPGMSPSAVHVQLRYDGPTAKLAMP